MGTAEQTFLALDSTFFLRVYVPMQICTINISIQFRKHTSRVYYNPNTFGILISEPNVLIIICKCLKK